MAKLKKGFSILEILVTIGITALLMGVVIGNYRRGGDDSILEKEINLLMTRVRLTQEQTAGGTTGKYCENPNYGKTCSVDSDCPSSTTCLEADTPKGGYAIVFNCDPSYQWGLDYPKMDVMDDVTETNTTPYFIFGDRLSCNSNCFNNLNFDWSYIDSDGLITLINSSPMINPPTIGDTLVNTYELDNKLVFKDLQIVSSNLEMYSCKSINLSDLRGRPVPDHGVVPAEYPLQATIRFKPPDGRQLEITDGVRTQTPGGNNWQKVSVMFGLKDRNTDCKIVSISKDGFITKDNDPNCSFES
ncbi:MAG: type II secretion system protein [Patescibacteria group bacterium]